MMLLAKLQALRFHLDWRPTVAWTLAAIIIVRLALGIWVSVMVPMWESYDEPGHYMFVHLIRTIGRIPSFQEAAALNESQRDRYWELGSQPPLYYALSAMATFWINDNHLLELEPNPWFRDAEAGGYNAFLHSNLEDFPYRSTALAVHLLRLFSVAMSGLVTLLAYATARLLAPGAKHAGLAAAAIVAFSPQGVFLGSMVTNDVALALCWAVAIFFVVRILVLGPNWPHLAGFWLAFICGVSTKTLALTLAPLALLVFILPLVRFVKSRNSHDVVAAALSLFLGAGTGIFLVAKWEMFMWPGQVLYWRIVSLLSLEWVSSASLNSLPAFPGLPDTLAGEAWVWFQTFWASFGWGNIGVDPPLYILALALSLAGALGIIHLLMMRPKRSGIRLSVVAMIIATTALIAAPRVYLWWAFGSTDTVYGRYAFAALSTVGILVAVGLSQLIPPRWHVPVLSAVGVLFLVTSIAVPAKYLAYAYARPPVMSADELSITHRNPNLRFGEGIELAGWRISSVEAKPGDSLDITLYWHAKQKIEQNYALALKIIGGDGRLYAALHSHPGRGNYPTSTWKVGEIIQDQYRLRVDSLAMPQTRAFVTLGFFNPAGGNQSLAVFDGERQMKGGEANILEIKITGDGAGSSPLPCPSAYRLGEQIQLIAYGLRTESTGDHIIVNLRLRWRAVARPMADYTVFVHLVDGGGNLITQFDGQPRQGLYPATLWGAGEEVADEYRLEIPSTALADEYHLRVGMYTLSTGVRLPVQIEGRPPTAGDYLVIPLPAKLAQASGEVVCREKK